MYTRSCNYLVQVRTKGKEHFFFLEKPLQLARQVFHLIYE